MVDFPAMLVYRRISFCRGPLSITSHIYLNSTSRNLKTNLTYAFFAFLMCTIWNYTLENAAQICKRKPVYKPWTDPDIYFQVNYLNNGNTLGISLFSLQEILFTMILTSIMLHFTFLCSFSCKDNCFVFFAPQKKASQWLIVGLGWLVVWIPGIPLLWKGLATLGVPLDSQTIRWKNQGQLHLSPTLGGQHLGLKTSSHRTRRTLAVAWMAQRQGHWVRCGIVQSGPLPIIRCYK